MKFAKFILIICSFFISISAFAKPKILILGDSLTEGYGVDKDEAYPTLLENLFKEAGIKEVEIVNAGVSGSTTAGGLSRLKWLLKGKPTHLVLALGANDGLRGLKLEESTKNLNKIIETANKKGIRVLLTGMKIPPNYGPNYTKKFEEMFQQLAKKYKIDLMPFLLENVAGNPKLNISDGIHPNAAGHKIIAKNIFSYVRKLIND